MIPEGWKTYKLEDICEDISYGYTESASSDRVGPRFLRITDIQNYFTNWDTVPYCPISANDHSKYKLERGDIVIARTGATTGVSTVFKKTNIDAVFASYLIRYRINKRLADPFYIGYILKSTLWKSHVNSVIGGSAQPNANAKQFGSFAFELPTLSLQSRIASILSSLDAKIELNLEMNKTLEAMAQVIFKEWFVDFNFPGFDGELIDGLPKGWRNGYLIDILDLQYGKALKSGDRMEGRYPVIGSGGIVGTNNSYFVTGPGIVIGRKGTIGKVYWIEQNFYPIDTTFFIKDLLGVSSLYFHYFNLKNQAFQRISSDSAVPGLNKNEALRNRVVVPEVQIVNMFNETIKPVFDKIKVNSDNITTLTSLRDSLLPKLMTGKIRVA